MIRLPSLGVIAALAVLAASCSKDSGASNGKPESPATVSGADADRIEMLERKIARLEAILKPRLGPPDPDPEKVYAVPLDPNDPIEGPADAKVTVVEGYEFRCPYCKEAEPVVAQLMAEFPKDVRVVAKYLVVHEEAVYSGLAACAANKQGKYPALKAMLWEKVWSSPDGRPNDMELTPAAMEADAAALGMDVVKFKADMQSEACMSWLRKSSDILHDVGQTGTPGFYVNGRALGGLVPIETLRELVKEELAKADQAIAGGVKQADYYQTQIVDKGLKKVEDWFEGDPPPVGDSK